MAKEIQAKNPNLRTHTPKAGPNSKGYKRRSKSSAVSALSAGRSKPLLEQVRLDKQADRQARIDLIIDRANAVKKVLVIKLRNYPKVLEAVEFMLKEYADSALKPSSPQSNALAALQKSSYASTLTPGQLRLARIAFTQELSAHLN